MGTDLVYTCVGNDTYEITLTLYRDCSGVATLAEQTINISSASCGLNYNLPLTQLGPPIEISPICNPNLPNSTCNGGAITGVEQYVYSAQYTFPQSCDDWILSHQICCRNSSITNSTNPSFYSLYIEALLDNLNVTCNNSPVFTMPPVPFICLNQPFIYNPGVLNTDGDSLVYSLTDPLDAPGVPVSYVPGFSPTYPISSATGTVLFDTETGQIELTPDALQIGIVKVIIEEYRNGLLIGKVSRDMQLIVVNSSNNNPMLTAPANVSGGIFDGSVFEVVVGNTLSFDIAATDADMMNTLTAMDNISSFMPTADLTVTGTNPLTATFQWTPTLYDIGNYGFALRIQDDACPILGVQVPGYEIRVVETSTNTTETELVEVFHIQPNPNAGVFDLKLAGQPHNSVQISIFNTLGQPVFNTTYGFTLGELNTRIELNDVPAGVYFVQISAEEQVSYRKVVVR